MPRERKVPPPWLRDYIEQHKRALALLRQSRMTAEPDYVAWAAGYWLERQAPDELRAFGG